jgi:hypothetical protein
VVLADTDDEASVDADDTDACEGDSGATDGDNDGDGDSHDDDDEDERDFVIMDVVDVKCKLSCQQSTVASCTICMRPGHLQV